ncbi:MAG TPA: AbrB/MazE/SpoVT family DNA-binding domain-containing protein [Candidatus Polarisedimenticolaceae bacterium]|nr:AbrB/MazE/SpoVT family DNA-binding domain-containing protein [Candidatus Polarisedimenticolaceae bacterium]
MQTKIQKWGNSLAVRIPKSFAEEAGVSAGSQVDLTVREDGLLVRPARARRPKLRDLLRAVKKSNLHGEVKTGKPVGKETW